MADPSPLSRTYVKVAMIGLSIVVGFFLVRHAVPDLPIPAITVDNTTLALIALLIFIWLLPLMKSVTLPGGTKIELKDTWPAVLAVRRMPPMEQPREMAARPPSSWRILLPTDPKVSLAGLRLEIETKTRKLAGIYDLPAEARAENLFQLTRRLVSSGVLTSDEENAILSVAMVCNQSVESASVSPEASSTIADLGDAVLQLLEEKLRTSPSKADE